MSEENNNSNNDLSREELNEQLDKVKQSARQTSLLKRAGVVTCYRTSQSDEHDPGQEDSDCEVRRGKTSGGKKRSRWGCLIGTLAAIGGLFLFWKTACRPQVISCYCPIPDRNRNEEEIRPTCYEIAIPFDDDIPNTESSPAELNPDAALEEVQQYYEKVKQESSVNNADNAETNDKPTEWILPHNIYFGIIPIFPLIVV